MNILISDYNLGVKNMVVAFKSLILWTRDFGKHIKPEVPYLLIHTLLIPNTAGYEFPQQLNK